MIYVVEDDQSICELVVYTLQSSGYEATGFENGEAFFAALANQKPELVLLDIMLPGEDGISILKKIRSQAQTQRLPVIMLTAKSAEYDKVVGLDNGADDYVTKPFGMMELLARVKAVLRRTQRAETSDSIQYKSITVDKRAHQVSVDGNPIDLTLKEYDLLLLLLLNQGAVMTRDMLLSKIWGYDFDGETRTVDVHVRTLRQKLGDAHSVIQTVRGVGYRIGGKD